MPIASLDFHLTVLRTQAHYSARVTSSPVGQASGDFDLPFSESEVERLSWRAGFTPRHITLIQSPAAAPMSLEEIGVRLFDTLFAGNIAQLFYRSLDAAERNNANLRIQLQFDDVPEIAALPWEYVYSRQLDRFLVLSTRTPLLRYIVLAQPQPTLTVSLPLRLLAIVSNPSDLPRLAVEVEWQRLQQALAPLTERGQVVLERLEKATLAALRQHLRSQTVNILHFIGHGDFGPGPESPSQPDPLPQAASQAGGRVFFENENGQHDDVTASELATLLHDHQPLRLVFLNACQGATANRESSFTGVAQKLVQQGIASVLAMQFAVSDQAAIALAHEFYQSLTTGMPLESAVSEARKALYSEGDPYEWGTPVLFSRAAEGMILDVGDQGGVEMENHSGKAPVNAQPWWQQLGALSTVNAIDPAPMRAGGDVIIGVVGAGAKNVAIGKHITQIIQEVVGPPTPDDKAIITQNFDVVDAALQQARVDAATRSVADSYLALLRGELVKTGKDEMPSASAITLAGNWLLDNLPAITQALAGLFATPAAARVVGKAGEAAVAWVKTRFG